MFTLLSRSLTITQAAAVGTLALGFISAATSSIRAARGYRSDQLKREVRAFELGRECGRAAG